MYTFVPKRSLHSFGLELTVVRHRLDHLESDIHERKLSDQIIPERLHFVLKSYSLLTSRRNPDGHQAHVWPKTTELKTHYHDNDAAKSAAKHRTIKR